MKPADLRDFGGISAGVEVWGASSEEKVEHLIRHAPVVILVGLGTEIIQLRDLKAEALVPGRGDALVGEQAVEEGIAGTQGFLSDLYKMVSENSKGGQSLKDAYDKAMAALQPRYGNWAIFEHCMPFNVSRAYDEAKGLDHPRIWTAERDIEMWSALEKGA